MHTEDSTTSSRCPSLVGSSDSYFLLNAISVYCCCWERPLLLGQPIHLSTNTTSLQLSSDTTTSAAPPVRQTAHLRHAYLGFLFRVCLRGKNASILDTKTAQVVFEDTQTAQIVFEDTQTAHSSVRGYTKALIWFGYGRATQREVSARKKSFRCEKFCHLQSKVRLPFPQIQAYLPFL